MRLYAPYYGQKKTKSWFALFPITINGETRWLERVTVQFFYSPLRKDWVPEYFIDDKEDVI